MNDRDTPAMLPPVCEDCGHRASLHHLDGCRALLLGRATPGAGNSGRSCGCETTLREILNARFPRPPEELAERAAM